MIEVWKDPLSETIHIKMKISLRRAMQNPFASQDFQKRFWDQNQPLSTRLYALADFIRRTMEKTT